MLYFVFRLSYGKLDYCYFASFAFEDYSFTIAYFLSLIRHVLDVLPTRVHLIFLIPLHGSLDSPFPAFVSEVTVFLIHFRRESLGARSVDFVERGRVAEIPAEQLQSGSC